MALSIRKQSVETKARYLASRRGISMTGAIEQALDNEIAKDEEDKDAEFERVWKQVREIQKAYAAAGWNGLTEQDIMGWDENGLPT
jgi:antitoxin VapB